MTELRSLAELGSPEKSQPSQPSCYSVQPAEMVSALVPEANKGEGKEQGSVEVYIWRFNSPCCRVKLAQPLCSFDGRTWPVQKQLAPGSPSSPSAKQPFHAKRN